MTHIASSKKNEITLKEIQKYVDDFADHGCYKIILTGGEPLTRKDFLKIYDYAYTKDFLIFLFTNATLFDSKIASFLKDRKPFLIEPPVYGMTKDTYETVTRVPGSYKKFWDGIHHIKDQSLPLGLKFIVLQQNKHELFDFIRFCKEKNIPYRVDPFIHPRLNKDRQPYAYRLPPGEAAQLLYQCLGSEKLVNNRTQVFSHCSAGLVNAYISSTGFLRACPSLLELNKKSATNLRKHTFDEARRSLSTRPSFPVEKKCKTCTAFIYCNQCAGKPLLATGNKKAALEYQCRFALAVEKIKKDDIKVF